MDLSGSLYFCKSDFKKFWEDKVGDESAQDTRENCGTDSNQDENSSDLTLANLPFLASSC